MFWTLCFFILFFQRIKNDWYVMRFRWSKTQAPCTWSKVTSDQHEMNQHIAIDRYLRPVKIRICLWCRNYIVATAANPLIVQIRRKFSVIKYYVNSILHSKIILTTITTITMCFMRTDMKWPRNTNQCVCCWMLTLACSPNKIRRLMRIKLAICFRKNAYSVDGLRRRRKHVWLCRVRAHCFSQD